MAALINVSDQLIQGSIIRVLDNSLTREEKPAFISVYQAILSKQTILDASAIKYGIVTEKNTYDNAITALTNYLSSLNIPVAWNNVTDQTFIDRPTFNQKFSDVRTAETALEMLTTDRYGLTTAIVYAYQRSLVAPTLLPGNVTFTFSSASITTPSGNSLSNGWVKTIPSGTDPLYVSVATAAASAQTDTIANAEWSTPVKLAENGTSGLSVATIFIYQRSGSASSPPLPSATVTYTFATGSTTGLNNGWTTTVPASGGAYLFVSTATAASSTATDTILSSEWSAGNIMAQNGTNGANGSNGSNGVRGSVTVAGSGYSSWSDSAAASVLASFGYGSPVNFDIVTLYGGSFSQTKYYSFGSWLTLTSYINGNLLVSGTVSANVISGGTLQGVTIQIGTGHTINNKAFEVSSTGIVRTDNIYGGLGTFDNYYSSSITAMVGLTNGNVEAIVGNVASSNTSAGAHGVRGRNSNRGTSGIVGAQNNFDFYADGSGTNYGPFTGAHDALIELNKTIEPGDIVVDVECISKNGLSNTIFVVEPSSVPLQKSVIGVWVLLTGPLNEQKPSVFKDYTVEGIDPAYRQTFTDVMSNRYHEVKDSYLIGAMNALGEGQLNVCGENGNIESGDLIVTSSIPGKGMKQPDDIVRSYTVAKARESVEFSSGSEVKQIACIYLCG